MSWVPLPWWKSTSRIATFFEAQVAQVLRRERGVVEVTVAAVDRTAGMMAGRPAQRVGAALAFGHEGGGGQRAVRGGQRGVPGTLDDRRARVEGVVAHARR